MNSSTKRTSQAIDNLSWDEDFLVSVVEPVRRNSGGTALEHYRPASEDTITDGTQISKVTMKTGDTTFQTPRLDTTTHSIQTVDYEHHEIHSGSHYFINGVQDLTINQVLDFTILTPDSAVYTHWTWEIRTESETAWYLYETATATNPLANAITIPNNNRNSLNTSSLTAKYEVQANLTAANADTNVSAATLLENGISGAARNAGNESRPNEIILKRNTLYCFRFIATAAGYIDYNFQWYEHSDKTA